MNLEEARQLVYAMRASNRTDWEVSQRLANHVLALADEVERLQAIEIAAKSLYESAGPLIGMPTREFVGSDEMSMLVSALYGPSEELMEWDE